jgi:flavin-dependent dehydrogenase
MIDSSPAESVPHVIIIGLGIVGLAAAIECREKGLKVTAFDKSNILEPIGMCAPLTGKHQFA